MGKETSSLYVKILILKIILIKTLFILAFQKNILKKWETKKSITSINT